MTNNNSITIRELEEQDLFNGFLHTLDSLRKASDIDSEKAKQLFQKIKSNKDHKIFVAIENNEVVATTTLLIEQKFIHDGGLVGHIEDVSVANEHQKKGLGGKVIQHVLDFAEKLYCYKTVLDCPEETMGFYKMLGFKRHSVSMRLDHENTQIQSKDNNSITIRELEEQDLFNGFLHTLDSLRKASDIDSEKAKQLFQKIKSNKDHKIFVAIENNEVVATTTLLIEQKFIHDGGLVGHIEDVSVANEHQGKGLAQILMARILDYAKKQGCYKIMLDCDDRVVPFYEKLGFNVSAYSMRFDHAGLFRKKPKVFLSIPMSQNFSKVREQIIRYLQDNDYAPLLIEEQLSHGSSIIDEITNSITESDFIIADISGTNPNVMYELGLAHGLKKQVLLLRNKKSDFNSISNLNQYLQFTYDISNLDSLTNAIDKYLVITK